MPRRRGLQMNESILGSIKKLLGISNDYDHFDADLIIHINSCLAILTQLGVGESEGFSIHGGGETWSDFMGANTKNLDHVKSFVYLKTRLLFDPPTSSGAIESMNRLVGELEWRINVNADTF